jgi:hypothetical protein
MGLISAIPKRLHTRSSCLGLHSKISSTLQFIGSAKSANLPSINDAPIIIATSMHSAIH